MFYHQNKTKNFVMRCRVFMKSSWKIKIKQPKHIWGQDLFYPAFVSPNIWHWVSYLMFTNQKLCNRGEMENLLNIISQSFIFLILEFFSLSLSHNLETLGTILVRVLCDGPKKRKETSFTIFTKHLLYLDNPNVEPLSLY